MEKGRKKAIQPAIPLEVETNNQRLILPIPARSEPIQRYNMVGCGDGHMLSIIH